MARTVLHGLGARLDRMPAGLLQMVGETGWPLSQGERRRLSIARTVLHGANCLHSRRVLRYTRPTSHLPWSQPHKWGNPHFWHP